MALRNPGTSRDRTPFLSNSLPHPFNKIFLPYNSMPLPTPNGLSSPFSNPSLTNRAYPLFRPLLVSLPNSSKTSRGFKKSTVLCRSRYPPKLLHRIPQIISLLREKKDQTSPGPGFSNEYSERLLEDNSRSTAKNSYLVTRFPVFFSIEIGGMKY